MVARYRLGRSRSLGRPCAPYNRDAEGPGGIFGCPMIAIAPSLPPPLRLDSPPNHPVQAFPKRRNAQLPCASGAGGPEPGDSFSPDPAS